MPTKIVISGEGGVGKTTIAALLARTCAREGRKVLAVDADPSPSLAAMVGIPKKEREKVKSLSTTLDLVEERTGKGSGSSNGGVFKLNPYVEDLWESLSVEGPDKTEVLVLGTKKTAGNGDEHRESMLLKRVMDHLLLEEDELVIMDMEAGLEHLDHAIARSVDLMLIVVEPGMRSLDTAQDIQRLSKQLGIKRIAAVANKVANPMELKSLRKDLDGIDLGLLATVPRNDNLVMVERNGMALYDAPGIQDVKEAIVELKNHLN